MKKKLIAIFMLIGCIPLLIASIYFSLQLYEKTMRENTLVSTTQLANSKAAIQNVMENNLIILKVLAENPAIKALDPVAAKPVLMNVTAANPELTFVMDNTGGIPLARGDNVPLNYNVTDRSFFKVAMTGKTAISEVIVSRTTGRPIVVIAVPIKNGQRIDGVAQVSIELENLATFAKEASKGETVVYILDLEGKMLAHPDAALAKQRLDMSKVEFVQCALKGEAGQVAGVNKQGRETLIHYARDEATGWVVCTETPKDVIMAGLNRMIIGLVIGFFLLVVVIFGAGYVFSSRTTKPITQLRDCAGEIAKGNLAIKSLNFTARDEIGDLGRAFDGMAGNLRTLIKKVSSSAEQLAASSQELTASAEQSSQATNQVAISIQEVAAGAAEQMNAANDSASIVTEMSAGIEEIAANASTVANQTDTAAEKAVKGGAAVDKAVSQMSRIEQTVNSSSAVVAKLGERSKEIGQIVDTISGIAGQTNLLALNAAIEAARAGEQGRGFAVVAEEVRKLAEQSEEAAKKIAGLIGEIQVDTDKAVHAMQTGTQEVKTGAEVVNAAGVSFREIADLVTEVSDQVKQISRAIQEMAGGSQKIVESVNKIDGLSKKSAGEAQSVSAATEEQLASMDEIASSSRALANLAQDLQAAVSKFRV
jgi:methyl-accepting chemotaxis protein